MMDDEAKSGIVAFLLGFTPKPLEPFSSSIISGLMDRLYHYHKNLLLFGGIDYLSSDELCEELARKSGGVIFIPPTDSLLCSKLTGTGLPLVAIADRMPEAPSVIVDNERGVFLLAEHLAMRGHKKILYRKDPNSHESANRRRIAFEKVAQYHGLELIESLPADGGGALSRQEEMILLSPKESRPTAVVAWADSYAYPVLKFCRSHHLSVPGDVAIAGFDSGFNPVEPAVHLTSIQAPWYRVAEKAVDMLLAQMQGEAVSKEIVFPVDLVMGDTT